VSRGCVERKEKRVGNASLSTKSLVEEAKKSVSIESLPKNQCQEEGMANTVGPVTIDGPAGVKSLIFRSLHGFEELGVPFRYDLELLSEDFEVKASDMLGKTMAVHLELSDGSLRHFHGYVTEFSAPGAAAAHARYRVTLRPWLWFLGRTTNCRIFQNKTVPDILKEVFRGNGFTDFKFALSGTYPSRVFVVQYRETDLNFVSRLMEQEGIYFFTKHTASTHEIHFADSYSAHDPVKGYEKIKFFPPDDHRGMHVDHVYHWDLSEGIEPGAYAHTDFDFEKPTASLLQKTKDPRPYAMSHFEVYDYPGGYLETGPGESYARVRLEELQATGEHADGRSNARGIAVSRSPRAPVHSGRRAARARRSFKACRRRRSSVTRGTRSGRTTTPG
jgi:type VI secretion system secreted protein VgrG